MYVCNGLRPSYASRPWGLLPCPVFVAPFGTLTWTSRGRPVSLSRHWDLWMTVNRSGPAQWMWRMWWKNCRKIPGAAENGRTFLKDLGPSGSQDVARWYDRYLASSWLTVRLYLHLQLQGFEASDCKIHYNPSQSYEVSQKLSTQSFWAQAAACCDACPPVAPVKWILSSRSNMPPVGWRADSWVWSLGCPWCILDWPYLIYLQVGEQLRFWVRIFQD